jgi:hypothetical protein
VRAYGVIAVVAVGLSWLVVTALSSLSWPEWLVSVPSVTASFGLIYGLFDRYLWRAQAIRRVGLSSTPDASGTYEGQLRSTHIGADGKPVTHPVRIEVVQTWTRMCVSMDVGSSDRISSSVSHMASVGEEGSSARLGYCYRNKVNPGVADADMGDHEGTADLTLGSDGQLRGRYYNSRPRTGSIEASRT